MADATSLSRGVLTNLSFALPPPFGPVAAAGLGVIFDLFGGQGPNVVAVIQEMIDAAVERLETFINLNEIQVGANDAASFLNWIKLVIPDAADPDFSQLTQACADHIQNKLLPTLEQADSYVHGSLLNNLTLFANSRYIQPDSPVSGRDADAAYSAVLTTLGALVAALKLKILLRTTLASFYAPDPTTGHCATNAVDQLFQDSLFESLSAAAELKALLLSRVDMPMNIQNALVDVPNEMTNRYLWLSAFNPPSEAQPFEATCPLENGSLKVKGYYVAPGFGFISDGDFDLNQVASSYGWTTAFLLLAARRVQAHNRLWFHGPIPWINGKAVPLENSVYYLMSPGESDVSKAVAGPFSGEGDPAVYQFFIDRGAAFAGYSPASSPSYHEDWLTMQTAAVSLQALLKELPPQTPANDVVIADWGADPPPPNSKWTKGWPVQYAISYQSSNGPSLRSQWGAAMDTQGRWKPMLRHVGPSPDPSWQIQIWRQFVTGDPENANGVPIIVSTVDGTATTFEDDDPALVES